MNGLNSEEITQLRKKYGYNEIQEEKKELFIFKILNTIKEPMFLLLLGASLIYFILGEYSDGIIMLIFIVGIMSVDIYQEAKTDNTLKELKKLSSPKTTVIRNKKQIEIESKELLPGDIMVIKEGDKINADGIIIQNSGLSVNEGILTGESVSIYKEIEEDKENYFKKNHVYSGTIVEHGTAYIKVTQIGTKTEYGKIANNLKTIKKEISNLKVNVNKIIFICTIIAFILFILVVLITYITLDLPLKERIIESVLSGITIAMCLIPEEYPVVLTVFLSMGAYRLAKNKALIKNLDSIETLGSITTLCVDKTGTITQNKMKIKEIYSKYKEEEVLEKLSICCENNTFDSMEKAILEKVKPKTSEINKIYPFNDKNKIMGIIRENILSIKGATETILEISDLTKEEKKEIKQKEKELETKGLRVLGLCIKEYNENYPKKLEDDKYEFIGLIGFIDEPKENIKEEIEKCYKAGIRVIMITGDNGITATAIAQNVGIKNTNYLTGKELHNLTEEELKEKVKNTNIFCRVIPEDKYKIVKALKQNNETVAMTGDGVNDAPALKYADIGIAMGKKGSDVAREAADLILLDDNFETITNTVKDGRRIFSNIKRAIGYILTIHMPIALIALFSPILGINPGDLMLIPVTIVLLELIIDPTCSIVLERQPATNNIMNKKPRNKKEAILNKNVITRSFVQGLFMFISSFGLYYLFLKTTNNSETARTIGLLTLFIENYFLVLVNSSMEENSLKSFIKLIKDKVFLAVTLILITVIYILIYTPFSNIVKLNQININQLLLVIGVSILSIFWFDIYKIIKKYLNMTKLTK